MLGKMLVSATAIALLGGAGAYLASARRNKSKRSYAHIDADMGALLKMISEKCARDDAALTDESTLEEVRYVFQRRVSGHLIIKCLVLAGMDPATFTEARMWHEAVATLFTDWREWCGAQSDKRQKPPASLAELNAWLPALPGDRIISSNLVHCADFRAAHEALLGVSFQTALEYASRAPQSLKSSPSPLVAASALTTSHRTTDETAAQELKLPLHPKGWAAAEFKDQTKRAVTARILQRFPALTRRSLQILQENADRKRVPSDFSSAVDIEKPFSAARRSLFSSTSDSRPLFLLTMEDGNTYVVEAHVSRYTPLGSKEEKAAEKQYIMYFRVAQGHFAKDYFDYNCFAPHKISHRPDLTFSGTSTNELASVTFSEADADTTRARGLPLKFYTDARGLNVDARVPMTFQHFECCFSWDHTRTLRSIHWIVR